MTRTRKVTISVKEFSHLVSESLDIANVPPSSQPLFDNTTIFSESTPKTRASSFHRIFSRPTPGQREDSPERSPEDLSETPRKMIAWPFSRSPRKNRAHGNEDSATVRDPDICDIVSPYSVTSAAAASTSSLGSLIPAHERLFQLTSQQDPDGPTRNGNLFRVAPSSPETAASLPVSGSPIASGPCTLDDIFGDESATSIFSSSNHSLVEPPSGTSNQSQTSFESTETSHSVANSEPGSSDQDPTPRALTFGPRAAPPFPDAPDDLVTQRRHSQRLSLAVPPRNLALQPAVGVAPCAPSETESSASVCSTSSPTSSVARGSSPTSPTTTRPSGSRTPSPRAHPSTPSNPRISAVVPDVANLEAVSALGFSPRQRKRAMSRSMTPPPLSRPPPKGPLPAVPSSVPPVPPLPPLLHKISMSMGPHAAISSPPRPTVIGAPVHPATALPPSPPGGLRLPSRLSWVNSVRAVLPSPPASPTKSVKSLTGKTPLPTSPSKPEANRPHGLKRPTSIGVIEAADNVQVRRTKSILLLGSRSKSNTSLGAKRVQIHADANLDADESESRKPRRKSSAPICPTYFGPAITPMPSCELLVPRERRHSAPMLSSRYPKAPGVSTDWTLSLPFCTDVPGSKFSLSPLLVPQLESEHDSGETASEDWTLCMPLKVRVNTPTVESVRESTEGGESECAQAETHEGAAAAADALAAVQLPTPSPSPTSSTPSSAVCPLEVEDGVPAASEDRPASPASLGPHVGGLDLAGGRGKRASGWHVYGWFDEVSVSEDECQVGSAETVSDDRLAKSHVSVFRKTCGVGGRHPNKESTSSVSTSETMFYSARSSLLVN